MKYNIDVNVEGSELILKNKAGDYVIIPKKYRREVQDMIKENCHGCIDKLVETLPIMEDYAPDGSVIPNDKKNNFEYKPYTAVQDNTYIAPRVVMPLELKKKQPPILKEQPVLKADIRTDQERKIAQEYTESVLNPSIRTQIGELFQKPLRWIADPVKGIGDIVSSVAPNSPLAKDLPNTNAETFEHRKKQLNPYISNKEKINNTINEAVPLTNWALLNTLPVEVAAGNMIKSNKNLIKPISKVVDKTDDVVKNSPKFKSEIDWVKWNPDTPKYPELINEYNDIEEFTKKAGTWMKNPDGSPFQGTPEQFIQQQSSWFKKAFPNVIRDEAGNVQKTYHGSQNTFDYFDPNIMMTGRTRGQGIYTSPFRERAASYATKGDKKVYEFYQNANKPQDIVQQFNKASEQRFKEFLEKNPKESKDFNKKFEEFMKKEDELYNLTDEDFNLQKGYDFLKASPDEYVVPFSNYPKSAIGNVGFFDMTNPNIYKGIIPPALLLYLQSQNQNKTEQ